AGMKATVSRRRRLLRAVGLSLAFSIPAAALAFVVRVGVPDVVLAVAAVLLIGVDRVMLGAHFPSDVLGGYLLGAAVAAGSALGYLGRGPAAPDEPSVDHPSTAPPSPEEP
ncbi:MAG: phosphatase PAP2 family protein, partial [Cellulomonas sp.]|nr:phosphatase PAP2 family protein [Cellulomonas sp.]